MQEFAWLNEDMKSLRRDFLPPELKNHLEAYGMDGTVAVQARQSEEETNFLLGLAEQYPEVVRGVVGWLDLRADDIEEKVCGFFPFVPNSLRSTRNEISLLEFATSYVHILFLE